MVFIASLQNKFSYCRPLISLEILSTDFGIIKILNRGLALLNNDSYTLFVLENFENMFINI